MGRLCLVTGGAGFIGSHLTEAIVRRGDRVRVADNLVSGFQHNLQSVWDQIEFHQVDVADAAAVRQLMRGVDTVFHQAARASVPFSVERPLEAHEACLTATLTLLDEARRVGVRRFVYAASSAAYGDSPEPVKHEQILPQPLSPYAAAKLAGEYYCQVFWRTYGLETVSLRYFNVFGPRQDPDSPYSAVIPLFITQLLRGNRPTVFGDGQQTRDFTYVENVVRGNLLAADAPGAAGAVINLADGCQTSLLQMLEQLQRLLPSDVEPCFEPARPGDVQHSLADISLARRLLGYEPVINFETGLRLSIDYYRAARARDAGAASVGVQPWSGFSPMPSVHGTSDRKGSGIFFAAVRARAARLTAGCREKDPRPPQVCPRGGRVTLVPRLLEYSIQAA